MLSDKERSLKERVSAVYSMLENDKLSFEDPENKSSLRAAIDDVYKEVYSGKHKDFDEIDSKFGALQSVSYHIDDYIDFHKKQEAPTVQADQKHATPIYEGQTQATDNKLTEIIDSEPAGQSEGYAPRNVYSFTESKKRKSAPYNSIRKGFSRLKKTVAAGMAAVMAAGIMYACKPEVPDQVTTTPKSAQTYKYEAEPGNAAQKYNFEAMPTDTKTEGTVTLLKGDNLTKIVREYNDRNNSSFSLKEIAEHNKVTYDGTWFKIHPGQEILFPDTKSEGPSGKSPDSDVILAATLKNEIEQERFKKLCLDRIDMDEAKRLIDRYGPSGLAWTLTGEYPEKTCKDDKKNVRLLKTLQAIDWYTGIYKQDSDVVDCKGKGNDGLWDRLMKRGTEDLLKKIIIPESAYDLIIKEYLEPCEIVTTPPAIEKMEPIPEVDTSGFTTMESLVLEQAARRS